MYIFPVNEVQFPKQRYILPLTLAGITGAVTKLEHPSNAWNKLVTVFGISGTLTKLLQNWYTENKESILLGKLGEFTKSVTMLNKGIAFITKHDSHYMLANCYYLMAILAGKMGQDDKKIEAGNRQDLFN
mgnify:CR=1 FL=1